MNDPRAPSNNKADPAMRRPLRAHVLFSLNDIRRERQWKGIEASLACRKPPSHRRAGWLMAFVITFASAASFAWLMLERAPQSRAIDVPAITQTHPFKESSRQLTLPDGSRVAVEQDALVDVLEGDVRAVRLRVRKGEVSFDVTHRPSRSLFEVEAGDVRVQVLGTRFTVARSQADRVDVKVNDGKVLVTRGSGNEAKRWLVVKGQSWSTEGEGGRRVAHMNVREIIQHPPTPKAQATEHAPAKPAITAHAPMAPHAPASAPASSGTAPGDTHEPAAPPDATTALSQPSLAQRLFDQAEKAQLAGEHAAAASLFDELRRDHRSDGRAAVAAFELGRLRADHLGDAIGALAAFEDALTLAPAGPFAQHAEARRVHMLEAMGAEALCKQARERYVARYPDGPHRHAIQSLCP